MATLSEFPLRIQYATETRRASDILSDFSIWRGNDVRVDVGVYFKTAPLDLSNVALLTLSVKDKQNPTSSPLAATSVSADEDEINATLNPANWVAGTEQHASFILTSAQMNLDLSGSSSRAFWLVLSGLTTDGKTITYGAGTITIFEDNAGDNLTPPTPGDEYYTKEEADALFGLETAENAAIAAAARDQAVTARNEALGYRNDAEGFKNTAVTKAGEAAASAALAETYPSFKNAKAYGVTGTDVTADTLALQALLSAGGVTFLPDGTYKFGTIIVPDGSSLICSSSKNCIFDTIATAGSNALIIQGNSQVKGFRLTSSTYASVGNNSNWDLQSRAVRVVGNNVTLEDIELENAAMGFDFHECANVTGISLRTKNIKSRYGQAAGFHASGATNVTLFGSYIEGADRITELEDGINGIRLLGGNAKNCGQGAYVGAPTYGAGATDFFYIPYGLDVHNHTGSPTCRNVKFDSWLIENCAVAIDVVQASANPIENITYSNITVDGISDAWSYALSYPITVSGCRTVKFDNLVVRGTATTKETVISINYGAGVAEPTSITFEGGGIYAANGKAVVTDTHARFVDFINMHFALIHATEASTTVQLYGTCVNAVGCKFDNVKGNTSSLIEQNSQGGRVEACQFIWNASATGQRLPASIVNMRASGGIVEDCTFIDQTTISGDAKNHIRASQSATRVKAIHNHHFSAYASPVLAYCDAGSSIQYMDNDSDKAGSVFTEQAGTPNGVITRSRNNIAGTIDAA